MSVIDLSDYIAGKEDGWRAATTIYGLRDCTIRNDGDRVMTFPVGSRECYIDLEPGEQAEIRTIEPKEWWEQ
jgi:hypothetical protein